MATGGKKAKVLISVDASDNAQKAVEFYVKHLHKADNKVVLIHAVEINLHGMKKKDIEPGQMLSTQDVSKTWEKNLVRAKELESKYIAYLKEKGINDVEMEIVGGGKAGPSITKTATEGEYNFVVMGTRGLGAVRRTLMGSVSDYVLLHAHCPVIVCKQ